MRPLAYDRKTKTLVPMSLPTPPHCEICQVPLEKPSERRTIRTRMEVTGNARVIVCCPPCSERVKYGRQLLDKAMSDYSAGRALEAL